MQNPTHSRERHLQKTILRLRRTLQETTPEKRKRSLAETSLRRGFLQRLIQRREALWQENS